MISLNIGKGGDIEIGIYDVNGRLVKQLFKGGNLPKGTHDFTWDATDASSEKITSGIYFVKAVTPQGLQTLKLVYLK